MHLWDIDEEDRSGKAAASGNLDEMKPIAQLWSEAYRAKMIEPDTLRKKVEEIKSQNKTIATLNGSFDLLHAGHLQILFEASQTADVLIVALNSDHSIQQYKGPDRPLIPLKFRLQMMAALQFVDFVTWFDEADPIQLLEKIRPNVHINGAEYGENCIEAETVKKHGGRLHIVTLVPGLSTTNILKRAIGLISCKVPQSEAKPDRSIAVLNEESMAKEDRSGKAVASETSHEIKPIAKISEPRASTPHV